MNELKMIRLKKMIKYIGEDYTRFNRFHNNILPREYIEALSISDDTFVYLNLDEMLFHVYSPHLGTDNLSLTEYSFELIYHDVEQQCFEEMKIREEESKRKREREIEYEKLEEALLYVQL